MTDDNPPDARESPLPPAPAPIVTDLATLQRRCAELERQNLRFRRWVKTECDLADEELDALVRQTADRVWAHIDCTACGRCCRADTVAVDDDDVVRLAARLGSSPAAFRRRHVRVADGEPGIKAGPCPFLHGLLCSVYTDRPKACADFPYLHAEGFRYRLLVLIGFASVCPVVFNTLEALKRSLPWPKAPATASGRRARRSG